MKFLLDHDVPAEIAHLLRYWEHNVTVLRTVLPVTASDEEVFGHACSQGLILISCNRNHFLRLARRTRDHFDITPHPNILGKRLAYFLARPLSALQ